MKLSPDTIEILRNYATINAALNIEGGTNVISTAPASKQILAYAEVAETFPETFCVYDINDFLNVMSLISEPEIEFNADGTAVTITSSKDVNTSLSYTMTDPEFVKRYNAIPMPPADLSFDIPESILDLIRKASTIMKLPHLVIEANANGLYVIIVDDKNDSSNSFREKISDAAYPDQRYKLKTEALKLLTGDYELSLKVAGPGGISQWKHKTSNVTYWVALEGK